MEQRQLIKKEGSQSAPYSVDKLDVNKALRPDGIQPKILKALKDEIV